MWAREDILSWCETFVAVVCSPKFNLFGNYVIAAFISSVWAYFLNFSSRRPPPVGDHSVVHQGGRLRESWLASLFAPSHKPSRSLWPRFKKETEKQLGTFQFFCMGKYINSAEASFTSLSDHWRFDSRWKIAPASVANLYLWNFDRRLYSSLSPRPPCLASNFKKMSPIKTTQQVSLFTGISMRP